jgi:23S rRNA pseudouridine2605 synthase
LIRINKYLSICGVSSRRGAEQLIAEKRVTVNDIVVNKPGAIVDEINDLVKVDGAPVAPVKEKYYILLNKPKKVLTSLFDPFKRKTVAHYIKNIPAHVYPVGRLDYDTDGVLLLTNDGDLAYRLAHPKYQVKKIYQATVAGAFPAERIKMIAQGIKLEDGHIGRADVKILYTSIKSSRLELTLTEGHKREVKQLMKAAGHPVKELRRVEFAGLRVDGMNPGRWRYLNHIEIRRLKDLVGL